MYIYVITNTVNGKHYVGQHVGNNLNSYMRRNVLAAKRGEIGKTLLYRAILKYGEENFIIRPLVYCEDKNQLCILEKIWILEYNSRNLNYGYNIAEGGTGGNTREGTKKSPEELEKLKSSLKGKVKSYEHRRNLSLSRMSMKCPWIGESNKRRASLFPTKGALRNRRYRYKRKLRLMSANECLNKTETPIAN